MAHAYTHSNLDLVRHGDIESDPDGGEREPVQQSMECDRYITVEIQLMMLTDWKVQEGVAGFNLYLYNFVELFMFN